MRNRRTVARVLIGGAALLLFVAAPTWAHHAFSAEFDANRPLKFRGTITKVEWINPHAWFHLDVKGPDGKVERWMVEAGTPNTLFRRGFTKASLMPGTEVVIDGFGSKDGARRMNGRNMTFVDGKVLFMGSSGTGAPRDGKEPTER